MPERWRRLSKRSEPGAEPDALHEGLPEWLRPSLARWLNRCVEDSFQKYTPIAVNLLHRVERNLQTTLDWSGNDEGAAESLINRALGPDADFGLEVIDCILAMRGESYGKISAETDGRISFSIVDLDHILEEGGSAWTVGYDHATERWGLQHRVDATVTQAARHAMGSRTRAADHLKIAWGSAYGRSTDAGKTYLEAVKAVEAAGRSIVLPNNPKATLGQMIAAMRDAPKKWTMRFTDPGPSPIAVVVEMMRLLWTSQVDRHGTDETQPLSVTLEEARDALHLALTLVQWFESGAIGTV